MCLLTFFPAGIKPDTTALTHGTLFNNDGHGFAIVTKDRIIVERGMDADSLIEAFAQWRNRHPDGPALFHSRFGTHGANDLDNCHPFAVGGDSRTVMAHNGILPEVVQPAKQDPRSDTRIAAEDFLPTFGSLRWRHTRVRLERWMTPHNKVVLLTVDPRFEQHAYILNESSGIWDGGIWYSNDGYLPLRQQRMYGYSRWATDMWKSATHELLDTPDRCGGCWLAQVDDDRCPLCGRCADCEELNRYCICQSAFLHHDDDDPVQPQPSELLHGGQGPAA
jgi:predicted glutamine amidotransferase